jgi:hypothetical protein
MKKLIAPTIASFILAGCFAPSKNISCMTEKGVSEWSDGSIENLRNVAGKYDFIWNEGNNSVQVRVMQKGQYEEIEVPATLNGTDLTFSAGKISNTINTANGNLLQTTTGSGPLNRYDGDNAEGTFVIKVEGTCSGF